MCLYPGLETIVSNLMKGPDESNPRYPKIIVCIPAYNVGKSVGRVIDAAKEYVDEIIVVNDGSTDDTKDVCIKAGAKVKDHVVNLGYGSAISSCLKAGVQAQAEIIITLDADLQHDPNEIPILIEPILKGRADIVTGSRFVTGGEKGNLPPYRRFGITMLTKVTNFMAQTTISDATTGFRAYSNHAAAVIASLPFSSGMGASSQILMEAFRSGFRITEVPVKISYGTGVDTSTQNAISMGMGILTSILRYITIRRPLSLIGIPGLVILLMAAGGLFLIFDIFNATRIIPIGTAIFTAAAAIIGLVLLLGSMFLYSLSTVTKKVLANSGEKRNGSEERIPAGSKKTYIIRYITIRRPLSLIGIPGLVILSIAGGGLFLIFDIFNATRIIPIGLTMFTAAAAIIGLVLLMMSVILYTLSKLLTR